jgi:hypothetical protein
MPTSFRAAATGITIALGLAAAAPAHADPSISFDRACYTTGDDVQIHLAGFAPQSHAKVVFHREGPTALPPTEWQWEVPTGSTQPDGTVLTSPTGAFENPNGRSSVIPGTIPYAAYQQDSDGNPVGPIARADMTVASFAESHIRPKGGERPSHSETYTLSGFALGQNAYIHYAYKGKLVKTIPLGAPQAPCGMLKKTVKRWPIRHPKAGLWYLVLDQHAGFANDPHHQIIYSVKVAKRKKG